MLAGNNYSTELEISAVLRDLLYYNYGENSKWKFSRETFFFIFLLIKKFSHFFFTFFP